MLDIREIDGAIAELEKSELNFPRVEKLAALYTIKNQHTAPAPALSSEGYAAAYDAEGSEFMQLAANVDAGAVLKVMDELMSVLSVTNPKAYNKIMRQLENISGT